MKNINIAEIWHLYLFEYLELNVDVNFFRFWLKIPFLDKLCPNYQNCQFKLKFGNLD